MTFEDLLSRLEDLVCDVVDRVLKSPAAALLYELNPVRPWISHPYGIYFNTKKSVKLCFRFD